MQAVSRPLRVLHADDDAADSTAIGLTLERGGFAVHLVRVDSLEALARRLDEPCDLVLAELELARFGALEALALLRRRHSSVPLIVVSASAGEKGIVAAVKHGAADYVSKGRPERLVEAVERALRASPAPPDGPPGALAIDERHLALVALRSHSGVVFTDVEGRVVWVNEGFTRMCGHTAEEMIGREIGTMLQGPDTDAAAVELMRERQRRGEPFVTQVVNYHRSGRPYVVEIDAQPLVDDGGAVTGFMAVETDVTERVAAERALQQSEEVLRLATSAAGARVFEIDRATQTIRLAAVREVFVPLPSSSAPGWAMLLEAVHPDDRASLAEAIRTALAHDGPSHVEIAYRLLTEEGDERWIEARGSRVEEQPERLMGVLLDVTARKKAEMAALAAARRTTEILESISDAFFALDSAWTLTYVNARAAELLGAPVEALRGRNLWHVFAGARDTEIWANYHLAAVTREPVDFTTFYAPLQRHLHFRAFPFDGGLSVYVRDVTADVERDEVLRRSEERFRLLANAMPQIVWIARADGLITYFNERWYAYTGIPRREAIEEPRPGFLARFIHPDDLASMEAVWQDSLRNGASYSVECRLRNGEDGAYRWFIIRAEAIRDEDGRTTRWFGTCTDIHQSYLVHEELRHSEERFQLAALATDDVIWDIDGVDGALRWEPTLTQRFGWPVDEATTLEWWIERVHPEDREHVTASLDVAIRSETEHVWQDTYRFRRADGTYADVLDRAYIVRHPDGRLRRMVGALVDLSDLRRIEGALRNSEERLRLAKEAAALGIFDLDLATGSLAWSARARALFGRPVPEGAPAYAEDPDIFAFVRPEDRERLSAAIWTALGADGQRERIYHTCRLDLPDGSTRWLALRGDAVMTADGQPERVLGIVLDITERKLHEAELVAARTLAEDAMRLKSALLANMSHEFRTPLTSILGFAEVLMEEVDPALRGYAEHVRDGGLRLLETLNSVLELARLEAGGVEITPEPLDLAQLAGQVVGLHQRAATEKGLYLLSEAAGPVPIWADRGAVTQVLLSLVANAVKFTDAGGVTVRTEASEGWGVVRVQDTGVGIAADFLPRLFDPFEQESTGETRSHEGTGLGLALAKRLVEVLGGTVTVESEKGRGSTFIATFPTGPPAA